MGKALTDAQVREALTGLPKWSQKGSAIERHYEFPDFVKAMKFVNRVAEVAEEAGHHPDISISYNRVTLSLISHDSGGITDRDIKMAGKIDKLSS